MFLCGAVSGLGHVCPPLEFPPYLPCVCSTWIIYTWYIGIPGIYIIYIYVYPEGFLQPDSGLARIRECTEHICTRKRFHRQYSGEPAQHTTQPAPKETNMNCGRTVTQTVPISQDRVMDVQNHTSHTRNGQQVVETPQDCAVLVRGK